MSSFPSDNYGNVKDWLKFAEAKNAAAVALSSIILRSHFNGAISESLLINIYSLICLPFIFIGLFLALISFLPKLTKIPFLKNIPEYGNKPTNLNIQPSSLYFYDISANSEQEYINSVTLKIGKPDLNQIDLDFLRQSHAISLIIVKKMKLFSWSLRFILSGIFTPIALLVLFIIWKNEE